MLSPWILGEGWVKLGMGKIWDVTVSCEILTSNCLFEMKSECGNEMKLWVVCLVCQHLSQCYSKFPCCSMAWIFKAETLRPRAHKPCPMTKHLGIQLTHFYSINDLHLSVLNNLNFVKLHPSRTNAEFPNQLGSNSDLTKVAKIHKNPAISSREWSWKAKIHQS